MPRKLSLKRDVLQELGTDELKDVIGGTKETLYSCLAYISCDLLRCAPTLNGCIE
jgi:hypothetical protein